ncbi:MAG: cation:proton antiporter, partial [Candidatus Peribacteraceae bacterium]|nr:cation:proton antiporter [Candidatus Peribacteraceae bacterium]
GAMGYKKRTGFLAGLTVAQISEFSLILVALGVKLGHLDPTILSFATIVGLITIGGSTYFIIYGKKIYQFLSQYLSVFERKNLVEHADFAQKNYDVLLLGYNHIGSTLARTVKKLRKKFLVVDYDPDVIANLSRQKIACLYGDLEDADIFEDLNILRTKMVVSTVKDFKINREIIRQIRAVSRENIIVVVSENEGDAVKLYDEGASYVVMPHMLGGHHVSTIIETLGFDFKKFMTEKLKHLDQLKA